MTNVAALDCPDVVAVFLKMRRGEMARLVEVAAGGDGGRAPDLGFPQAVGDEVDDALLDLEDPRHAEEGGGLGEDARRRQSRSN
jgi:hypothetical protein